MNIYEILQKKRFAKELSNEEIDYFVKGLLSNIVSREQAAALLMAFCINGISLNETAALTQSMTNSGKRFDFSAIGKPIVDKHSTGGVGDKISLLLVPIMISLDVAVPMISGRGLGHTGGTIDKLEAISGFRTELTEQEMWNLMEHTGGMIVAQTEDIAPADKIIYSIRDVTATVESDGLITASILSKKLAEGLDALVLDLKIGNGAFFGTLDAARGLISKMEAVAKSCGLAFKIVPTDMSNPLGFNIGNWIEVVEVEDSLKGNFPIDVKAMTYKLASEMLIIAGKAENEATAFSMIDKTLTDGKAYEAFHHWIEAQGGSMRDSYREFQNVPMFSVRSKENGVLKGFDTKQVGFAAIELGAGRKRPNDELDLAAGIKLLKKQGETVDKDEAIAVFYARDTDKFASAENIFLSALNIE